MKISNMKCPIKPCDWEISPLISLEGEESKDADHYVTQYSLMVEHLQEDHDAQIGGRA